MGYTGGHDAGWSSPVAREAHNLEVAGSNPVPATFLNTRYCTHARDGILSPGKPSRQANPTLGAEQRLPSILSPLLSHLLGSGFVWHARQIRSVGWRWIRRRRSRSNRAMRFIFSAAATVAINSANPLPTTRPTPFSRCRQSILRVHRPTPIKWRKKKSSKIFALS